MRMEMNIDMKITPHYTITQPPAKKTNCHVTRKKHEEIRNKVKKYIEKMQSGNSFTIEGLSATAVSNMVAQLCINWGIKKQTTVRTLENGSVRVWIV